MRPCGHPHDLSGINDSFFLTNTEAFYMEVTMQFISPPNPESHLFRFRPYVVGRAEGRRKDATSSFPSRAVTCGVVYSYGLCWCIAVYTTGTVEWWMPLVVLLGGCLDPALSKTLLAIDHRRFCLPPSLWC